MGRTTSFKDEFTFEQRVEESQDILAKYPDRVPVIVEKYARTDLPQMEKKKYLVPRDMSVGQFSYVLSGRLDLARGKALFVFVKDTSPQTASLMDSVYESFKDTDGFLYTCYSNEKTFGGHANVERYEERFLFHGHKFLQTGSTFPQWPHISVLEWIITCCSSHVQSLVVSTSNLWIYHMIRTTLGCHFFS